MESGRLISFLVSFKAFLKKIFWQTRNDGAHNISITSKEGLSCL